jgi:hypothetical protein
VVRTIILNGTGFFCTVESGITLALGGTLYLSMTVSRCVMMETLQQQQQYSDTNSHYMLGIITHTSPSALSGSIVPFKFVSTISYLILQAKDTPLAPSVRSSISYKSDPHHHLMIVIVIIFKALDWFPIVSS